MADLSDRRVVRFGPFGLDARAGELRKHGIKIKLREQPVRILAMLVEHPGEVVLREEIRLRLWPNNTIVEFDHGINAAVQKLRDALGDSASEPRYVETVARRGYRFLGEVERVGEPEPADLPYEIDESHLEGTTISHYRILEKLGQGGMGVVWRAHDPRLKRDVAIKISEERFSDRFEREARAIAALNHPNICTLYDVGPNFLVMELIEGESPKGPLPLVEALRIAHQIADALDAAHEKGIIHRDLKPGNIKVKPDGSVKVLDFGLAKTIELASGDPEDSPTVTVAGMIMGTAAYMSPEQARGKIVDKRADIWAFGVVLYELLTGRRPFHGNDLPEMLASVMKDQPDLSIVPAQVRPLLERCLEKDPKKRLRDIGDAWEVGQGQALPSKVPYFKLAWIGAPLLLVIGVALWASWRAPEHMDRPLVRLDVELGTDVSLPITPSNTSNIALSPDGTRIAYPSGTPTKLFVRQLDQPKPKELAGTEGAYMPFFSPDGRWIGFYSIPPHKVLKISVEGGAPIPVVDSTNQNMGASWSADGSILVSDLAKGLMRIPVNGLIQEVAVPDSEVASFVQPELLPGGKAILFANFAPSGVDKTTIEVLTLADHRRKIVARGGSSPRYVPTSAKLGHLIYLNKSTLFAVPFDLERLETRGAVVPILNDVEYGSLPGGGQFDFSQAPSGHGTFVYRTGISPPARFTTTLEYVDQSGKRTPLPPKPGAYRYQIFSPDGNRIALTFKSADNWDIWVYDPQRDALTRLTFGDGYFYCPVWTPDGQHIVFASSGVGFGIFQARSDGSGQPQSLAKGKKIPYSFTPDGKRLAYLDLETGASQIWTAPVEEQGSKLIAGKAEQFLKTDSAEQSPTFSPDGRWLAYRSNESGKMEDYVRSFSQSGKWQISTNGGGHFLKWSRSGHDLFYENGNQIMVVSYTVKGDSFVAEKPRVWLDKFGDAYWDLAPDGKRVLVAVPAHSAEELKPEHNVVFLENFFDELRRKAPVGK